MKTLIYLLVTGSIFLSLNSYAKPAKHKMQKEEISQADKKMYVYGAINMGRRFEEIGEADNNAAAWGLVHFERPGFGIGVDYRLDQKFLMDELEWRAGFYYELKRESQQLTSTAGTTRQSDLELQAKILSITALYKLEQFDVLLGANYTLMDSDGSNNYKNHDVKNDYGFHAGAGYERDGLRYQLVYRYLTHETKDDNGYTGEINLSSFLITIGKYF